MLLTKHLVSLLGAAIDVASTLPYIVGIARGRIRPHLFSWLIWVVVMGIGFLAQLVEGAGVGSWVLGTALLTSSIVLLLSLPWGERRGTRSDWICLIAALAAIPLWIAVKDPLPSVVLVTAIDVIAYGPTLRKAWHYPHEELVLMWSLGVVKFLLSIVGLEAYSLTTWLYPAAIAFANAVLVTLLIVRRAQLPARKAA